MNQLPAPIASVSDSAQDELYKEYAPQGVRYAKAILHNSEDAEEAVHDAFVKLLNSPTEASRWPARFFTSIRNLCIDVLRRRTTRTTISLSNSPEPTQESGVANVESEENLARIRAELDDLPSQWKQALLMKLNEDKTYLEIAQSLNATHAQVRSWIFRARKQLKERLLEPSPELRTQSNA